MLATSRTGVGIGTSTPKPAIRSSRGNRPSAIAPRNRGMGYPPSGARIRTAESGIGEKMTNAVVQNGARRNAAMLQRTLGRCHNPASDGRAAAQSTRR